jgi:hypothetical protein
VWSVHAKRKEPEEIVVELLRNVSLSPPKRVRVSVRIVPAHFVFIIIFCNAFFWVVLV